MPCGRSCAVAMGAVGAANGLERPPANKEHPGTVASTRCHDIPGRVGTVGSATERAVSFQAVM